MMYWILELLTPSRVHEESRVEKMENTWGFLWFH